MAEREILEVLNNQVEMAIAKIQDNLLEASEASSKQELLDILNVIAESVAVVGKLVRDAREEANNDA